MGNDIVAGRYKLIREIGSGAMGSVWLAEHLSLGSLVALKIMKAEFAMYPAMRARFQREARIAAQLRSVHVVKVFDHGVMDDGAPYIVMEHLEGESLRQRLASVKVLPLDEMAAVLVQVCRAVTKAHEVGLVHRDLKPENIFLVRDVDQEVAKVLDFGIVKVPDALAYDGVPPTATGALLGTPCYMSPEQAQGLKTVDFRSDLWSLGVVVYECLTGVRPFAGKSLAPLIRQITMEPIPPPSQAAPAAGISPAIDAWIARALSRDPSARFASARELAETFERLAQTGGAGGVSAGGSPPGVTILTGQETVSSEAPTLPAGGTRVDRASRK